MCTCAVFCSRSTRIMKSRVFVVVIVVLFGAVCTAEPSLRICEPIRVKMCMDLGYNVTGMPNLVGHERQNDAVMMLRTYQPLIEYGCSAQLKFFLCSVYIPMCTDKVMNPIGPCRGLCEQVHSRCYPVLKVFGFPWPDGLNCSLFPSENNHEHMCMEGPSEMSTGLSATSIQSITVQGSVPCSRLIHSAQYIYLNRSGRCVPFCNGNILFDVADKNLAEVWLSIWAALCFVSTIVALLSFAVDSSEKGRYPEKPLVFLALCYCLVSVGWGVRSAAGRAAVSCRPDVSATGRMLLTEDGFGNANCAVVFLLLYYFGMAASVWWVVVCGCWMASAGLRWTQDRLQGLSSLLHLAAWGIPAVHTVTVLVQRNVDADELTGICYVGSQNFQTLLWLVLVPHTSCLIVGIILLILGGVLYSKRPKGTTVLRTVETVPTANAARTRSKNKPNLLKLGVFGVLYIIPLGCLVGSYAYEYSLRQKWLTGVSRPALWIFLLRIFMSLVVGITSIMWVWTPRTVVAWRKFLGRLLPRPAYHQPPVKYQQPLPVLRYVNNQAPKPPGSAAAQPLTRSGSTLPSNGRHSSRSHKHRSCPEGNSYHKRSGSETIL